MQILEKLNSFYSGAFGQLITYTVGVLALVGVLVPAGIAAFQNRQLKRDQAALSAQISAELLTAKTELSAQFAKEIAAREEELRKLVQDAKQELGKEIKKIDELAIGRSLHLQALTAGRESPGTAVHDSLEAIRAYVRGGDERNLRAVLRIFEEAIEKVDQSDFKPFDLDECATSALEALKELNQAGRYADDMRMIRLKLDEAKQKNAGTAPKAA